jgi:hypothetical protein
MKGGCTMSKFSRQQLEEIVKTKLPGFHLTEEEPEMDAPSTTPPEARTPDLEALRRKYLRSQVDGTTHDDPGSAPARSSRGRSSRIGDQIVYVEPDASRGLRHRGAGTKAVVIDDDGEITAFQG